MSRLKVLQVWEFLCAIKTWKSQKARVCMEKWSRHKPGRFLSHPSNPVNQSHHPFTYMENTYAATSYSPIAEITNASSLPRQMQSYQAHLMHKYHFQNGMAKISPLCWSPQHYSAVLLELEWATAEGNIREAKIMVHGTCSFNTQLACLDCACWWVYTNVLGTCYMYACIKIQR